MDTCVTGLGDGAGEIRGVFPWWRSTVPEAWGQHSPLATFPAPPADSAPAQAFEQPTVSLVDM